MLLRSTKCTYWVSFLVLLPLQCVASPPESGNKTTTVMQSKATELAQHVAQGVVKTHYGHVVGALQQLDDAQLLPIDQLVDPLTPLYELTQALNVAGREYFLVPELKLYIAQVAHRFAQRIYLSVCENKRLVAKETKATMLKHLDTTLSLLDPSEAPVTAVLFHLRYVRAVVDNLPEHTSALQTGGHLLLNLIKVAVDRGLEAGIDVVKMVAAVREKNHRSKLVEEVTAVEILAKAVLKHGAQQAFRDLIDWHQATQFEETQYAVMQALGRIARGYYGKEGMQWSHKEASQQAFTAFSTLLEVATPKDSVPTNGYVKCAAVVELILLQNLLDAQYSKVVGRYLSNVEEEEKKTTQKHFAKLRAKKTSMSSVQCVLAHRDVIFRMAYIGHQEVAAVPQDPTTAALERIEARQKTMLEYLQSGQSIARTSP